MVSEQAWIWYLFLGSENPANIKGSLWPAANRLSSAINYHLNERCVEGKTLGNQVVSATEQYGGQMGSVNCCKEGFLSGQNEEKECEA